MAHIELGDERVPSFLVTNNDGRGAEGMDPSGTPADPASLVWVEGWDELGRVLKDGSRIVGWLPDERTQAQGIPLENKGSYLDRLEAQGKPLEIDGSYLDRHLEDTSLISDRQFENSFPVEPYVLLEKTDPDIKNPEFRILDINRKD